MSDTLPITIAALHAYRAEQTKKVLNNPDPRQVKPA